jgi:hypothetical protein
MKFSKITESYVSDPRRIVGSRTDTYPVRGLAPFAVRVTVFLRGRFGMDKIRFDDLARAVAEAGDHRTSRRSMLRLLGFGSTGPSKPAIAVPQSTYRN